MPADRTDMEPVLGTKLRVVFCGTPCFATPSLETLAAATDLEIQLVVTQPDRPCGRGLQLQSCAVKKTAGQLNLPLAQPCSVKEIIPQLEALKPDVIAVVAFGEFIPKRMLELPRLGCVNIHPSLLPKYRGAAPMNHSLLHGDTLTGVTSMLLNSKMDAGDILMQVTEPIHPEDDILTMSDRLSRIGADLLLTTLRGLRDGRITPMPQDHNAMTLAPLLKKEDGLVDWSHSAQAILNRLRAFRSWPGLFTRYSGKTLKILSARVLSAADAGTGGAGSPGGFILHQGRLLATTGDGLLELLDVQLEGKKAVRGADFYNGLQKQQTHVFDTGTKGNPS